MATKNFNPMDQEQECNLCGIMVQSETVVSCASCGFDTCVDCMNDDLCDDCVEIEEGE